MGAVTPNRAVRAMTGRAMVEKFLRPRGITDERVLDAMATVPRHHFVPEAFHSQAYEDRALPIGSDQTISQPYIVARMTEALALTGKEKVLEIGSGSGYQTAVLAHLAKTVFSVEKVSSHARRARTLLEGIGLHNVSIRAADGNFGWTEFAPYDRIIVTAAAREIPEALVEQLTDKGRLVIPIGAAEGKQELYLCWKEQGRLEKAFLCECSFVPFV